MADNPKPQLVDVGSSFLLIGNIPTIFRSAQLRTYFSNFVEKKHFKCFHYRHRPEHKKQPNPSAPQNTPNTTDTDTSQGVPSTTSVNVTSNTTCCVVALEKDSEKEFLKSYQNKNWSNPDGDLLPLKVRINKLRITNDEVKSKTDKASAVDTVKSAAIPWTELKDLPELNPPSVMPQGNVGTPLSTFMALIRSCKLPAHVIKKLQLEFPKNRTKNRYGAVGLEYGTDISDGNFREDLSVDDHTRPSSGDKDTSSEKDSDVEHDIPSDDDHDAEEWDRYEAFHDDVDKQERTKERLFEEELEVVWDKGSSGLVFYTDASYWDKLEGDFDEKCSQEDDWNVDMSVYYDSASGDKDARDMRDIEMERRLREGEDTGTWKGIGGFEKHTKGIGSRVLKKSGWSAGSGVGLRGQGIPEPLEADGQHPHVKRGLGYRGEKLDRSVPFAKRKKQFNTRDVIISTVYDKPAEEVATVLRSAPPTTLKYRGVQFLEGGLLNPEHTHRQDTEHKDC